MKKVMILSALLMGSIGAHAEERTEIMANACAGCHGTDGYISHSALVPLAGLPEQVFLQTMLDYRDDKRKGTIMGNVAKGLTIPEIEALSKYFAALPEGGDK